MDELVFSNGVDFDRGTYTTEPFAAAVLAAAATDERTDSDHQVELRATYERLAFPTFAPVESIDPGELGSAGWAVVFAEGVPHVIRDALRPLLSHRQAQVASRRPDYYKEYIGPSAFRPTDTKRSFLARNAVAVGMPANPELVPYYLLLVAPPTVMPFEFQCQLDVEYAVGQLWFEEPDGSPDLAAFERYACSVVDWERGQRRREGLCLFGPVQPNDVVEEQLAHSLIRPLADGLQGSRVEMFQGEGATKKRLLWVLGHRDEPAVFLAASHGVTFATGHPGQRHAQGAIVCQDWLGPFAGGPLRRDAFFGAADVEDARVHGLIGVFHASYSAGTPAQNSSWTGPIGAPAPAPFLSRLPQALLAHRKGGALAVIGFCDQAWGPLGRVEGSPPLLQSYVSFLKQLLHGQTVGYAMEVLNQYDAEASSNLSSLQEAIKYGRLVAPWEVARLWAECRDARSTILLGDPAVRTRA
jgi:hypothetical protein